MKAVEALERLLEQKFGVNARVSEWNGVEGQTERGHNINLVNNELRVTTGKVSTPREIPDSRLLLRGQTYAIRYPHEHPLISYMRLFNELVDIDVKRLLPEEDRPSMSFFTDEDIDEISKLSVKEQDRIWTHISYKLVKSPIYGNDWDLDPNCVQSSFAESFDNMPCHECSYGKRHGLCRDNESTYGQVISMFFDQKPLWSVYAKHLYVYADLRII
jgi:hypothetical protein